MLEHKENQQRIAQRKQRIRPTCGANAKNGSSTLPLLLLTNTSSSRPWLNIPGLHAETFCSTGPYTWQPSMTWTFPMDCSQDSLSTSQGPEGNEKVVPLVPKLLKIKNSNSRVRQNISVEPSEAWGPGIVKLTLTATSTPPSQSYQPCHLTAGHSAQDNLDELL